MNYKRILEDLHIQAVELVKTAVVNQQGCIGTLYKHSGKRYEKTIDAKKYDFSPTVSVMDGSLKDYNGIGIFNLVEIFLDKKMFCIVLLKLAKTNLKKCLSTVFYLPTYIWSCTGSYSMVSYLIQPKIRK